MKRLILALLLFTAFGLEAAPFDVYYYLPTGNSARQVMRIEASDPATARRIFSGMMPKARISEVKYAK